MNEVQLASEGHTRLLEVEQRMRERGRRQRKAAHAAAGTAPRPPPPAMTVWLPGSNVVGGWARPLHLQQGSASFVCMLSLARIPPRLWVLN